MQQAHKYGVHLSPAWHEHLARKLILEGSNKIYEIADIVGYSSARYFTDQFRRQFGVSPVIAEQDIMK